MFWPTRAAGAAPASSLHHTDRGGDVTYHGPGQIVCYPIFDLREWKRDVVAYVRGIEEVLIGALSEFDIQARRIAGATGVWVSTPGGPAKIAAIGVHISRWVASHGFALNVDTDLTYFRYIVPCGLTQPVTSMTGGRVARATEGSNRRAGARTSRACSNVISFSTHNRRIYD